MQQLCLYSFHGRAFKMRMQTSGVLAPCGSLHRRMAWGAAELQIHGHGMPNRCIESLQGMRACEMSRMRVYTSSIHSQTRMTGTRQCVCLHSSTATKAFGHAVRFVRPSCTQGLPATPALGQLERYLRIDRCQRAQAGLEGDVNLGLSVGVEGELREPIMFNAHTQRADHRYRCSCS